MWKEENIQLGVIKASVKQKVSFQYIPEPGDTVVMNKIGNEWDIHTSCGCTSGTWDEENLIIEAIFNPKPTPQHLRTRNGENKYQTTKSITGNLIINGTRTPFILFFSATILG